MKYQIITQYKDDKPEIKTSCDSYKNALDEALMELLDRRDEKLDDYEKTILENAYKKAKKRLVNFGYVKFYDCTIGVVLETLNMPQSRIVDTENGGRYREWDGIKVTFHLEIEFISQVAKCRHVLEQNPKLNGLTFMPKYGLLDENSIDDLDDTLRYRLLNVEVDRFSVYYQICSCYDGFYTSKYKIADIKSIN
jgi:hypothetical protein